MKKNTILTRIVVCFAALTIAGCDSRKITTDVTIDHYNGGFTHPPLTVRYELCLGR